MKFTYKVRWEYIDMGPGVKAKWHRHVWSSGPFEDPVTYEAVGGWWRPTSNVHPWFNIYED